MNYWRATWRFIDGDDDCYSVNCRIFLLDTFDLILAAKLIKETIGENRMLIGLERVSI